LKTAKLFERRRSTLGNIDQQQQQQKQQTPTDTIMTENNSSPEIDFFAIERIEFCADCRQLAVAGQAGQVILFKFDRQETNMEISVSSRYRKKRKERKQE